MKFGIARDSLAEAVGWVARSLPARPVVPLLAGILIEAGERLALSCFDYDVSARFETDADVTEPGTALVPGRLLADITRSLAGEWAEFGADADSVGMTCGSAEFTLVRLAEQEYPALPALPPPAGTVPGAELAAAVAQVAPAASRDDTLPMLTGVFAQIDGELVTLAATDRYRLAVRNLTWQPARPGLQASALIPARTLAEAARTMGSADAVSITLPDLAGQDAGGDRSAGMIGFEGAGRRLTTRLLGSDFLNYASRFPRQFGSAADIPAGPFIEAVRRVSLVAERGSAVRLAFGDDEVVIEAGTQGQARAVERVPALFSGDERVIAFNPHYLLDGLTAAAAGAAPGHEPAGAAEDAAAGDTGLPPGAGAGAARQGGVRIEFTSAARPAVITAVPHQAGDDPAAAQSGAAAVPPFRYLVVPLRLPGSM